MSRPTPETDAARHDLSDYGSPVLCSWGDWIHADVASKLERERDEALNQIQVWENKWKIAINMAAIAEIKCSDLKEEIANLQDQLDLAMKVIKRLEANQP